MFPGGGRVLEICFWSEQDLRWLGEEIERYRIDKQVTAGIRLGWAQAARRVLIRNGIEKYPRNVRLATRIRFAQSHLERRLGERARTQTSKRTPPSTFRFARREQ